MEHSYSKTIITQIINIPQILDPKTTLSIDTNNPDWSDKLVWDNTNYKIVSRL